jgi:rSAM/selenodomain-associated transferase 1
MVIADPVLAVFLRAPRLGAVKSRLAAEVGERTALRLYRLMATRTLAAARAGGLEPVIWFTPSDAADEIRAWLGGDWSLRPQASGDLGARLAAAAAVTATHGWLAIGVDCPRLSSALLTEAAELVRGGGLVLGPTEDGGYYLIGGRTPLPDLFSHMPWGTSGLLQATRARLSGEGRSWHELAVLRDVDTAADARAEGLLT